MVTDHPMKTFLADDSKDDKWYRYQRFMVEDPELLNAVRDGKIKKKIFGSLICMTLTSM